MKKHLLAFILSGLAVLLLALFSYGFYTLGYQNGNTSGYAQGLHVGHTTGYTQGEQAGYTKGKHDQSVSDSNLYFQGEQAGKQQFSNFYDWLTNSCGRYYNTNYYEVTLWLGSDGMFHYSCIA